MRAGVQQEAADALRTFADAWGSSAEKFGEAVPPSGVVAKDPVVLAYRVADAARPVGVAELAGAVVVDDLGRQCVTHDSARALFAERAEAERRQREAQQRREAGLAEQAANNRPRGGVPADRIPDGVLPAAAMLQAARDAEPRRRSGLEEALDNETDLTYHPLGDRS